MIRVGLTRFDEHVSLTGKNRSTLFEYASYLPLVELDTAFYAIPKKTSVENWISQVPKSFRFILKGYSGLTKQEREPAYYASEEEMAAAFLEAMQPLIEEGRLFCFLLQFPAYFVCNKENVNYLRKLHHLLGEVPITIEFRNESWYEEKMLVPMRKFMEEYHFSLGIIDEPQVPNRSVPLDGFVTNPDFAMMRLHGRNVQGWSEKGEDWRQRRTLYRYNHEELMEIKNLVEQVQGQTKEVAVIFNNNSGGDAADNGLELVKLLGLEYTDLNPKQLDLF